VSHYLDRPAAGARAAARSDGYGLLGFAARGGSARPRLRARLDNLTDPVVREPRIGFPGPGRSFWPGSAGSGLPVLLPNRRDEVLAERNGPRRSGGRSPSRAARGGLVHVGPATSPRSACPLSGAAPTSPPRRGRPGRRGRGSPRPRVERPRRCRPSASASFGAAASFSSASTPSGMAMKGCACRAPRSRRKAACAAAVPASPGHSRTCAGRHRHRRDEAGEAHRAEVHLARRASPPASCL